jgi:magnesium chelatase family protein
MAHNGVLFLDELPEFHRRSLEVLREPLEKGHVTISRSTMAATFPARFILVASMNPCPCGYMGDPKHVCKCLPMQVEKYMGRISGPLLDRIDLHIEVPAVPFAELSGPKDGTSSLVMRDQVRKARAIQAQRFGNEALNSRMSSRQLRKHCGLNEDGQKIMQSAMEDLGLSARAHDRILKMARTIADLDGADGITVPHLSEAIGYRNLDRRLWAK